MKTFNVALLSDDTTCKSSYFFSVKADSEEEAIMLAQSRLRGIIIDQYGDNGGDDVEFIDSEVMDYTPEIFELKEI